MRAIIHENTLRLPQIVKFNIDRYDSNSSQSKFCFGIRDSTKRIGIKNSYQPWLVREARCNNSL